MRRERGAGTPGVVVAERAIQSAPMDEVRWNADVELDRPLMVVALKGLFDAAEAATAALDRLATTSDGVHIADIDAETFFNFQEERPVVELVGEQRQIRWPQNRIWGVKVPDAQHDLVLLSGVEPHLRWKTFADALLEIADRTGAEMVITLGAMVGLAPHTRPLGVVGSAANTTVADRLGLGRPSYQGPTGLVGALHDRLDNAGMPVVSLRVSVPHYVPGPPNPEATRSLLARLELITGIPTGHSALQGPANDWRQRIDAAVTNDDELADYVRQLEEQVDESDVMPSGDDIAAELEAFLRDQRDE